MWHHTEEGAVGRSALDQADVSLIPVPLHTALQIHSEEVALAFEGVAVLVLLIGSKETLGDGLRGKGKEGVQGECSKKESQGPTHTAP